MRERYTFKILLLGDSNVGKSSLTQKFLENKVKSTVLIKDLIQTRSIELYDRVLELQMYVFILYIIFYIY